MQIISDPTYILPQSSSCSDLTFTNQPNYVIECDTQTSLHPKCQHQATFVSSTSIVYVTTSVRPKSQDLKI